MGNIKHNDELLRVHDDGFDVVFNCDNKHQNGVSYHAEKNGKKTKIDPEYAMATLVKKVSGAGWPADLPAPSAGGYGYTTTEVTNVVELTCKRPETESCWAGGIEVPEGLIVGESYEVTVNGVTGTYECFEHDGLPALGYPYEFDSYEPNKWAIYDVSYDGMKTINVGMNLRPGETATIVILSKEIILEYDYPEVDMVTADEIQFPDRLIVGEKYEVTVNGVTGTYECVEDDEGGTSLGYLYELMELHKYGAWAVWSYDNRGINVIGAGMNLRPGETTTFVIKLVGEVTHKIDEKYLPEGGFGWTEQVEQPVIVDNETVTTVLNRFGVNAGTFATPFDIVDGAYTVIFNGTEYNLNSAFYEELGFWYLGAAGGEVIDFSRYPFSIINIDGTLGYLYTESAGDYEVTIKMEPEIIHKIDEKYLPASSGMMVVNAIRDDDDEDLVVFDKTFEEIHSALPNVAVHLGDSFYKLELYTDETIEFGYTAFCVAEGAIIGIISNRLHIESDNIVTEFYGEINFRS